MKANEVSARDGVPWISRAATERIIKLKWKKTDDFFSFTNESKPILRLNLHARIELTYLLTDEDRVR